MSIAEWDHMVSEMPDGKHRRGVWEYSEWEERGQAHQCIPWANWDGPGKEYDVPEVLEIQSIESSASGPGILAQFGEETTAWSEDAATPPSWMDAMMA